MAGSKEEKHFTLMFVRKGDEVLLGRRKRGHVNMRGKWNGFGGKVEVGEDVLEAAIREVKEECGIRVNPLSVRRVGQFTGNVTRPAHFFWTFGKNPWLKNSEKVGT